MEQAIHVEDANRTKCAANYQYFAEQYLARMLSLIADVSNAVSNSMSVLQGENCNTSKREKARARVSFYIKLWTALANTKSETVHYNGC
jgi:hypothetical protein